MACKGTSEYSCQAWVVALTSLFSSLAGMAQIAYGIWLVFFSMGIGPILGAASTDVYYGYIGIGAFTCLTALLGCTASMIRRVNCLIMYMTILFASIAFQCAVGAFIYVEQNKVSNNLIVRIAENPEISENIDFHFNCRLHEENDTLAAAQELEICAEFAERQLWNMVWGQLGLCGAIVCLQFVLFVMACMMSQLVRHARERANRVHPARKINVRERANKLDSLEAETTSSTAPFFSSSPPITPSTASSAAPHYNLATSSTSASTPGPLSPTSSLTYHNSTYQMQRSGIRRESVTKL